MGLMSYRCSSFAIFVLIILGIGNAYALELSIKDAETVAIQNDPMIVQFQARAQAYMEESVVDGQLPDPQLRIAAANIPLDSFSFTQEPMTQAIVGLRQGFPSTGLLDAKSEKKLLMAEAERANAIERAMLVLRNLRKAWMDVYFQTHAFFLIEEHESVFEQLVKVTQYQYRAGRGQQQDVVRAQLELSLLQDRRTSIVQNREKAIAELEKWTGASVKDHQLSKLFPELPTLPTIEELGMRIEAHPSLAVKKAVLGFSRKDVAIEKAKFKPNWALDLSYGYRGGENVMADGSRSSRADFASAVISMDLPFFTEKRQHKRLNATGHRVNAANDAVDSQRRELRRLLDASYADWQRLGERLEFYKKEVLPQAAQYAETTRKSYQSRVSDFSELVRARLRELESNMQTLRLRTDRAKAHYDLQYLAGEA